MNPIIYYFRTNRFRSAFKQFVKDPFGSSDFKEKPTNRSKGEKQKGEVDNDGKQKRYQYSVQQGNDVMDLAFKSLQVRSYLHESGESKKNGETREQSGSACERKPCEKTEKRAGEENEELLREFECAFRANKIINQTQGSFRGNVWRPRIAPLNTTRHPSEAKRAIEAYHAEEKTIIQRSFTTRRDTATTVQGFQTGPKAAWITDEDKLWGQEGEDKTELNISMRENNKEELQWVEEKKYRKEKKQNKKKDEGERKEEEKQKKEKEKGEGKKDEQRKKEEKGEGKERKQKKKEEEGKKNRRRKRRGKSRRKRRKGEKKSRRRRRKKEKERRMSRGRRRKREKERRESRRKRRKEEKKNRRRKRRGKSRRKRRKGEKKSRRRRRKKEKERRMSRGRRTKRKKERRESSRKRRKEEKKNRRRKRRGKSRRRRRKGEKKRRRRRKRRGKSTRRKR